MGLGASSSPKHTSYAGSYPKQAAQPAQHSQPVQHSQPPQQPAQRHVQFQSQPTPAQKQPQAQSQPQQPPPQQQPPQQPKAEPEEKTDIKVKKVKLDKHILEKYLDLEKQTRHLESQNVLKNYRLKQDQLKDFDETIQVYEARYKECVKQTEKEKADVDDLIKDMFKSDEEFTAQQTKEQEEYLEALNKQEIAKKELDQAKKMKEQVKTDCDSLKKEADKVQKIYTEQDELLAGIFNGKYGSDLEYKLESELDMLLDRKQRISVARYKWHNGRLLIHHAVTQLAFAVRKWTDVIRINQTDMQSRYVLSTETRNNVVAASQNITSAHKYLNTITFPYCTPGEMATLNKAVNNIYTDMQSNERHQHAMLCYGTTHKRSAALLQWFDHVIKSTIQKDFDEATKSVDAKTKELRQERLRLIKEKIHEAKGDDENLDMDGEMDLSDEGPEPELENLITDADAVSNAGDVGEKGSSPDPSGPTPLPSNQLAPAPNNDELFGNIDALKKQHESQMEDFSKAQDVNKARMNQGLEEKLKARRSRRARQETQD